MATQKTQLQGPLLNVHTRYDRPLKKKDVLPHYPKEIGSTYGKDFIPSDVTVPHTFNMPTVVRNGDDGVAEKLKNVPQLKTAYKTEFGAKKGQPDHKEENAARFKKTHPGGDLLIKNSEYEKRFGQAGTSQDKFERPTVKVPGWEKLPLPVEGTSTTKKTFTTQPIEKAGLISLEARTDYVNVFHRNRNGQVVGHKYDSVSKHTDYRVEYPTRTVTGQSHAAAATGTEPVSVPHRPVESSTHYKRNFVDYHVRHSQLVED